MMIYTLAIEILEEKENRLEVIFEEVMAQNFSKLTEDNTTQI